MARIWPAAVGPQFENCRCKVTERDALRHAFEAPGMKIHADERRSVHEKTDGDEKQAAFENVKQDLPAGLACSAAFRK